jgi:hypothetical protein
MQFANQRAFREKPFGWSTAVIFEVLRRALDIARGGRAYVRCTCPLSANSGQGF